MNYPIQEHNHTINGVEGRMFTVHAPQLVRGNMVHRNQKWMATRPISRWGSNADITVEMRFDDECQNGRQTFSITASIYTPASRRRRDCEACGCLHEDIARVFPELAPLIKWHLMSTDGPMHYIANTVYHASDRDHHGLRKGESRQIRNGKTGLPCWVSECNGERYVDSETEPAAPIARYVPMLQEGVGKERDLNAARNAACWPEATDADLMQEPEQLKAALAARLPALIAAFRADMERAGFLWEPEKD